MLRSVGFVTLQRDDFGYLFVKMARINYLRHCSRWQSKEAVAE